jgi:CNT family concentrative nucleoside transporter
MGLQNFQSLTGIVAVVFLCWLASENRRRFPWKLVLGGIVIQVLIVLVLFGLPPAQAALQAVGRGVDGLGAATRSGSAFVFGYLAGGPQPYTLADPTMAPFVFGFQVLPVILVVCALSAMLWHWGVLKVITKGFGLAFQKTMKLRGPPALAAAATIFMGQVEGPIFIRSYLDKLTRSELFVLMSVGLACVSGSTMVAYAALLKATLPNAAAHVLTASIVSAPAGVALARVLVPAADDEADQPFELDDEKKYDSTIDAVIRGTTDGLAVVLNVAASLIVFVAMVALVDQLLALLPAVGGKPVSIERGLSYLFYPLAWAIGIPAWEAHKGGELLGVKLVLTEFTAFIQLGSIPAAELSERSRMLLTYALCGFANVASVGITSAGFGVLAPSRRPEVLALVWKALFVGFLATCMTASIVGLLPNSLFR